MDFYYSKKDISINVGKKTKNIIGVTKEELDSGNIPINKIYCGNIYWEVICAQQKDPQSVLLINTEKISKKLLPYQIESFKCSGDFNYQIKLLQENQKSGDQKFIQLALINATGTMLGDSLVGSSIFENISKRLKQQHVNVEVDVFVPWNARPGVETIWQRTNGVRTVYESSPTIEVLSKYDAYWSFTKLLKLPGFESEHFADFYLNHFGFDPSTFKTELKIPVLKFSQEEFDKTKNYLDKNRENLPVIFVQAEASTPARSMPDFTFLKVLKKLIKTRSYRIVVTSRIPKGLTNFERKQILDASGYTFGNIDRYFALIFLSDYVLSVDTLSLHAAIATQKRGLAFFSLSEPYLRLKYSPTIQGVLIPNADTLPYWNRHKSDNLWESNKLLYEQAWEDLPLEKIIQDWLYSISKK